MDDLPAAAEYRRPKRLRTVKNVGYVLEQVRKTAALNDAELYAKARPGELPPVPPPPPDTVPVREHPTWPLLETVAGAMRDMLPEALLDVPVARSKTIQVEHAEAAQADASERMATARMALWTSIDRLKELKEDEEEARSILDKGSAIGQARALRWVLENASMHAEAPPDYVLAWYRRGAGRPAPATGRPAAFRDLAGEQANRILLGPDLPSAGPGDGKLAEGDSFSFDAEGETRPGEAAGIPSASPPSQAWEDQVRAALVELASRSLSRGIPEDFQADEDPERAWGEAWEAEASDVARRALTTEDQLYNASAAVVSAAREAERARAELDRALRFGRRELLPLTAPMQSAVNTAYVPIATYIRHLPLEALLLGPRPQLLAFAEAVVAQLLLNAAAYPRVYRPVWTLEHARRRTDAAVLTIARLRRGTRM